MILINGNFKDDSFKISDQSSGPRYFIHPHSMMGSFFDDQCIHAAQKQQYNCITLNDSPQSIVKYNNYELEHLIQETTEQEIVGDE